MPEAHPGRARAPKSDFHCIGYLKKTVQIHPEREGIDPAEFEAWGLKLGNAILKSGNFEMGLIVSRTGEMCIAIE